MKIKKRYIFACIIMCILALALSLATFYLESGLARYSKLNKVTSTTWLETSGRDPETGVNTDLFITKVIDVSKLKEDAASSNNAVATSAQQTLNDINKSFEYIGKRTVVDGKYVAYGKDVYGNSIIVNDEVKMGDRISVYYKPDDPLKLYYTTDYTPYIILLGVVVVIAAVLIVLCRILNKSLKDNTFSDATVTIMDIPIVVIIAGIVISFFLGMLVGNLQVDSSYTQIYPGIAEQYASHEIAF